MTQVTCYICEEGRGFVLCPSCRAHHPIDGQAHRDGAHRIEFLCTECSTSFTVHLEFRQHHRKPVQLEGTCHVQGAGVRHQVRLLDLSRGGAGFAVHGPHDLRPGQLLRLSFRLDDRKRTLVEKMAKVRFVRGQRVGCQFTELVDEQDRDLGFYLRS